MSNINLIGRKYVMTPQRLMKDSDLSIWTALFHKFIRCFLVKLYILYFIQPSYLNCTTILMVNKDVYKNVR